MKRGLIVTSICIFILGIGAPVASADHIPAELTVPEGLPIDAPVLSDGPVRHIANIQAAQSPAAPLGEAGPFERDGRQYFAASSMTYGLHIVDVTDPMAPFVVSGYAASFGCNGVAAAMGSRAAFGLLSGWENDQSVTPDGRFAVIGADSDGRCHDPREGGMELVDLTDLENPRTLHLTRNVGEAHSITIDPSRPWLVWLSTSDGADFIEVIDISSCDGGVADVEACRPEVARIPFTRDEFPGLPGDADSDSVGDGCHDIRFSGPFLYCAAIGDTLIFDTSDILDGKGRLTGTLLTEGEHACPVFEATLTDPGVMVTDCMGWTEEAWAQRGGEGARVELLSVIEHGSGGPTEAISIAHQAEPTRDGKIMFVTDERGGGLLNESGCPGGGVTFYDIRDKRNPVRMQQPDGSPAIWRTPTNLPGTAHMSCTIHYGEQVGDENLMVFAWYLNGVRMVRYTPDFTTTPATVTFEEVGAYLAAGSSAIQAKPIMRNPAAPDEIIIYSADLTRGLDVMGFTVPRLDVDPPSAPTGTKVLGKRLAATGVADTTTIVLLLGVIATFIARRLRPA